MFIKNIIYADSERYASAMFTRLVLQKTKFWNYVYVDDSWIKIIKFNRVS